MKVHILESQEELEDMKRDYGTLILQFSANWCGPCRTITPQVKELMATIDNSEAAYIYCDIDQFDNLAQVYGVSSIPSFSIYRKTISDGGVTVSVMTKDNLLISSNLDDITKLLIDNNILKLEQPDSHTKINTKECRS